MRALAWLLGTCLALGSMFALGAPGASAQEDDTSDPEAFAQRLLGEGDAQLEAGQPEEALASFRRSGELVPSPEASYGRGRAFEAMQQWPDAADAFDEAVREAGSRAGEEPRYAELQTAAQEARARVAPRVGLVVVRVPGDEVVRVGGRLVAPERLGQPVPVMPGYVEVTATDAVGERAMTVEVEAGAEVPVTFDVRPPAPRVEADVEPEPDVSPDAVTAEDAPPEELPPPGDDALLFGISFGGIAAVGWAIGIALNVAAADRFSELRMRCGNNVCPADLRPDIDGGRQIEQASLYFLAASGVLTFASITLLVWDALDLD